MKPSTILILVIILASLVLTGVVGLLAFKALTKKAEKQEEIVKSIPVHVTKIETGTVEDVVYVTGEIEPHDKVNVLAKIPMPGKLIEARVKKGDRVRKNQIMMTVDRDEVGAVYLAYGVKAPLSGVVASIEDDPGALITAQQPVAVIINIDKVKVKTSIIEADLDKIHEGTKARVHVDAWPEKTFEGEVTRMETVLDEYSHTAPVEVTVNNAGQDLLPGMFARVELVADEKSDVPVVAKEAVFKREGRDLVFLVDDDREKPDSDSKRIYLTELELGYYDLHQYEIISGIEVGDLVVDRDQVVLKDQTEVSIMNPADVGLEEAEEGETAPGEEAGEQEPAERNQ